MFQRTLLRQAQAARSVLSVRSSASTLRRTSQLQPQLPAFRPLARQPAYRFYSTENKAENGKEEQKKEGEEEQADPLRAELEKKEKEVVELKVCFELTLHDASSIMLIRCKG